MKLLLPLVLALAAFGSLKAETLPRWQFPPDTRLEYKIEEDTTIDTEDGGTSVTHSEGTIEIHSWKGNGLLDLQMHILESMIRGQQMTPEDVAHIPPITHQASLTPEGKLASGTGSDPTNLQLLLDLTFPLPGAPLSAGQPVTEKISMKGSGKMADLEGKAVFTHRGYKTIEGEKYLSFTVDCKLESPPGLPPAPFAPDPPAANVEAKIECLFDEEHGFFYSVSNTMHMNVSMASPRNPSYRHTLEQSQVINVRILAPSEDGDQ